METFDAMTSCLLEVIASNVSMGKDAMTSCLSEKVILVYLGE